MTFEEFKKYLIEHIQEYLPQEYSTAHVEICDVVKNNGMKYSGLVVRKLEEAVAPSIYINLSYDSLLNGKEIDEILKELASDVLNNQALEEFHGVRDMLFDFEQVKDKIIMKVVNAGKNKEYLHDKVHTVWEDLAIIYQVLLRENEEGRAVVTINADMFGKYDISKSELNALAKENTERLYPGMVRTIHELVPQMMDKLDITDEDIPQLSMQMYVITNKRGINGAAAVFCNDELLRDLSEQVDDDLIILPSSIHELIAIPASGVDKEYMLETVKQVNSNFGLVSGDDVLADNVYHYNRQHNIMKALFNEEEARSAGIKNHR